MSNRKPSVTQGVYVLDGQIPGPSRIPDASSEVNCLSVSNEVENDDDILIRQEIARQRQENFFQRNYDRIVGSTELLPVTEMPDYLQSNPGVIAGYRGMKDFTGCITSVAYFHNESINIFTHGFALIMVIWFRRQMFPWDDVKHSTKYTFLGILHVTACVSPWIGSVIYHMFMNHNGGEEVYHFLLRVDVLGIWVAQSIGGLPSTIAATWKVPESIPLWMYRIHGFSAFAGLLLALKADDGDPMARRFCFLPMVVSRLFFFFIRLCSFGGGDALATKYIFFQELTSIVGGIIGGYRVPEIWFPGKVDYSFNSHNIMHVLVMVALYFVHTATIMDMEWIVSQPEWLCASADHQSIFQYLDCDIKSTVWV